MACGSTARPFAAGYGKDAPVEIRVKERQRSSGVGVASHRRIPASLALRGALAEGVGVSLPAPADIASLSVDSGVPR